LPTASGGARTFIRLEGRVARPPAAISTRTSFAFAIRAELDLRRVRAGAPRLAAPRDARLDQELRQRRPRQSFPHCG
jgi:hypothetical protein